MGTGIEIKSALHKDECLETGDGLSEPFFFKQTTESLAALIRLDTVLHYFLISTGFMLPGEIRACQYSLVYLVLWMCCWVSRLGIPFLFVYLLCDNLIYSTGLIVDDSQYYQWVCNQLQILAVIPLVWRTLSRLGCTARECELPHYRSKLKISFIFCAMSFLFSLLFFSIRPAGSNIGDNSQIKGYQFIISAHYPVIAWGEFLLACNMSVCLLFILVDIEVSKCIVHDMMNKIENKLLTVEYYNACCAEINRRVDESFYSITTVVVIALLNIIAFFLRIFVSESKHGGAALLAACNYYLKEIVFLLFCFYDAAQVNEMFDRAIRQLGSKSWGCAENELRRTQVFMNAVSRPISFELAGLRFKRKDVLVKFGSVLLASVIGFIRLLVMSSTSKLQ